MYSLSNNLPSNVRKVPPNSLEGQKWLQFDKFAHSNGMITGPPHTPNQCRYFAIYFMEMRFVQVLTTAQIYFLSQIEM